MSTEYKDVILDLEYRHVKLSFLNEEWVITKEPPSILSTQLDRELVLLRHVQQIPNCIRMIDYKTYPLSRCESRVEKIFLEYANGGDLYKYTCAKFDLPGKSIDLKTIAFVARQVATCLFECRTKGILHLDIKPDNIFIQHCYADTPMHNFTTDITTLKKLSRLSIDVDLDKIIVADWGMGYNRYSPRNIGGMNGTLGYVSPEMLSGNLYKDKCDIFSLGSVLYELLSGKNPFMPGDDENSPRTLEALLDMTKETVKSFDTVVLSHGIVPTDDKFEEPLDLIRKMLTINPLARIDWPDILKHPWLNKTVAD